MPYSSDFPDTPPQPPQQAPPAAPVPAQSPPLTTRPRLLRTLILPGLLFLFVGLTALGAVSNAVSFARSLADNSGTYGLSAAGSLAGAFALDLWACLAALLLGLVVNRAGWGNGKRLAFGGIALTMMAGRLIGGGAFGLATAYIAVPPWVAFVGAPLALMTGGAFLGVVISAGFFALFATFVVVPNWIFRQIRLFENELQIYRVQTEGLSGYVSRFLYWLRNEQPPPPAPDDSRGARFATFPEISRLHTPDNPEVMTFGHLGRPLALKNDKHVLIMASTRSGKGVTLIIPHLLRYPGSAFVLDPKGENARATGRQRAKLNGKVHYLDPFGISGKPQSRFNPLARFTPLNMEAESKALAAALFVGGGGGSDRTHWMAAAQQLVASIILYVHVAKDIPRGKKDLPAVRRILLGGLKMTLEVMKTIDDADGLLHDLAISFLETPEKEFGSIVSTALRQTEILDNPYIIKCLAAAGDAPEVDFKAWHSGTMTVYLCLSAPKFPTFNRWLRLVLVSALDEMTERLNPPPVPVCFMLDELATLGHLAPVENAVGLSAGYGIQLVNVFQDTAQMRDLYKSRWASFIGNAGVRALFNLDDFDTAEYWSKFIGSRLVETRSRQEDIYGLSQGNNVGEAMHPLLAPDQIMMDFAAGKMLVLAQGAHPIITDRVSYWDDASLSGLWDDPRIEPRSAQNSTFNASAAPAKTLPPSSPITPVPAPAAQTAPSPDHVEAARSPFAMEPRRTATGAADIDLTSRATIERDVALWMGEGNDEAGPRNNMIQAGAYTVPTDTPRNALCPCGSDKKYKHCHGALE